MAKLAAMRYKNYTWPHNPRVYMMEYRRSMAAQKVPFGQYRLQDLGPARRVLRGEGEFAGEGAYDEFKKLAAVFYSEGPGILIHPIWQPSSAYFVALSLRQEPRADYVSYTFEFWENYDGYGTGLTPVQASPSAGQGGGEAEHEYHTVIKGESLWHIAARQGVTLETLIRLNPQIKNPNLIYPGERVRIK